VVEAHGDFVQHRRLAPAHLVRLPEGGDLGQNGLLADGRLGVGQRQTVEPFEFSGDAPALEQHHPSRHLGGVGGEDRDDLYPPEPLQGLLRVDPGLAHALQGGPQRPRLGRGAGDAMGAAAPLAMVGLGKVGEFEKGGEGLDDPARFGHRHAADDFNRALQQGGRLRISQLSPGVVQLPVTDRQVAQFLFRRIGRLSLLLADDRSQKPSQGADVTAQWEVLALPVAGGQLIQASALVARLPEIFLLRHAHVLSSFAHRYQFNRMSGGALCGRIRDRRGRHRPAFFC
jgi:hypothetical protein